MQEVAEEDYEVEENGRQAEEELERMMQEMDVRTVAWTRSQGMEEGQELDFDNQAYDMFHRLQTGIACVYLGLLRRGGGVESRWTHAF